MLTKTAPTLPIIKGNLFDYVSSYVKAGNNGTSVIVPHVCNNINLFGAGFAANVADQFPIVKENYHLLGLNFLRSNLGYVQSVEVLKNQEFGHKLIIANMIAQNNIISKNNPRPLNYAALVKCMQNVNSYIRNHFIDSKVQIHAPKFGCGLAGGNWLFIQDLIQDIWYKNQVFIYQK